MNEGRISIEQLSHMREREDHVEFKRAMKNYPFAGGEKNDPRERRHCVLGYIVALANEKGGRLVLGMEDKLPHKVSGTDFAIGKVGALTDEIYKRLHIRVDIYELYDENNLRVLVIEVPSRPIGKALRFEGVPLMRTGGSLREMGDSEYFSIISESDPDFSARICGGMTLEDIDEAALNQMRHLMQLKGAAMFSSPTHQLLRNLGLLVDGGLTYAALILLGKSEVIRRYLPQDNVVIEYRTDHSMTRYSARAEFRGPLFTVIEDVWNYINQPAINPLQYVENLPQIIDVPSFSRSTIREAVINAIVHRSLQMNGDILIRLYPDLITVSNPGGFPYGVNIDNILTVNSSPRSRLVAEVIQKAGLIERSGQGVDIMFSNCIMEGKRLPDYSKSDDYQVCLTIYSQVMHPYLLLLLRKYQSSHPSQDWLNVFDLISMYCVAERDSSRIYSDSIDKLLRIGLIKEHPVFRYVIGDEYYGFFPEVKDGVVSVQEASVLYNASVDDEGVSMSEYVKAFEGLKTVKQTRTFIQKCCEKGILVSHGKGRATRYVLAKRRQF